ncbi:MAG: ABC transporter permease [Thermoplasmata archaeon]|nr:ABC transporter permease [Thermoplasmata archaeon]
MSERNRFRSFLALVYLNGILPMRTQPLYLVNTIISPLAFLFFVFVASRGMLFASGITGGLILTILSTGTGIQADLVHYKADLKFQDVVVASPVEAPIYVAGMAFSEFVYAIPGLVVFLILGIKELDFTVVGSLTLIGTLVLVWAFASALGFTIATFFVDIRETFVFAPILSLILSTLPPVYYPISYIPAQFQWAAYLAPTTYAADLLHRALCAAGSSCAVAPSVTAELLDWAVLIGLTAVLFLLAATKARWREP